jgi:hypothetical protein
MTSEGAVEDGAVGCSPGFATGSSGGAISRRAKVTRGNSKVSSGAVGEHERDLQHLLR